MLFHNCLFIRCDLEAKRGSLTILEEERIVAGEKKGRGRDGEEKECVNVKKLKRNCMS